MPRKVPRSKVVPGMRMYSTPRGCAGEIIAVDAPIEGWVLVAWDPPLVAGMQASAIPIGDVEAPLPDPEG